MKTMTTFNKTHQKRKVFILIFCLISISLYASAYAFNSVSSQTTVNGLSGTYFTNSDLTGSSFERIDQSINFDWKQGSPASTLSPDRFSTRWTGNIKFPTTANWSLHTYSDDGVRLFIDDKLVINDWTVHPPKKNSYTSYFVGGTTHKIKIEYYNRYLGASIKFRWSNSALAEQPVPSSALTTTLDDQVECGYGVELPLCTPTQTSSTTTTTKPATTTTKPTTTTTKPATTSPTTTAPANFDCFSNSIGVVDHPINLSTTGRQKVWVKINSTKPTNLVIRIDSTDCITQTIASTNSVWTWIPINTFTPSVSSGSHQVRFGSSSNGVKLSNVVVFNSSISCTPVGDGSNCPPTPTTTTSTTTRPPATTTPTTTTPVTSPPQTGSGNADNLALEKFRNTDPLYGRYANLSSEKIPLTSLISKANPSSSVFFQNGPNAGQFRTICEFSHFAYDDPIIKPMQPGSSHLHMFYGNTGTNAYSTPYSIANSGGSTCDGQEANRTAYWFPVVHDAQGRARTPNGFVMYYKSEGVPKPPGGYSEMPQGLKIIAGNANATSPQKVEYNNGWGCGNMFINPNSALIPNCTQSTGLMLKVHFPRCWDGSFDFDPANPQAHVRYEVNGQCPSTHSKVFTGMTALFDWDLAPGETTAGWYLSSDRMPGKPAQPGGQTIHGDWFGGWHNSVMKAWTQGCSNTDWNCSVSYLGINNNLPGFAPGGVNQLNRTTNKFDSMGPITCVLPPRTYK